MRQLLGKSYIENSNNWETIEILSGAKTNSDYCIQQNNADSVGLCLYRFKL